MLEAVVDWSKNPPWHRVPTTCEDVLKKIEEKADDPKAQLAEIDYFVGILLLLRSRIASQGGV